MRHRLAALAVVLIVASPARLGSDPQAAPPSFPLWPIPREARVADARLLLTEATIVVPPGDTRAQYPGRLLAELVADHFGVAVPVAVGAAPPGRTPVVVGEISGGIVASAAARSGATVPEEAEGYLLSVDAEGAVVAGRDYRGALYGVSSFAQLVQRWGRQSVAARQAVVRDWPFLPVRWVHPEMAWPDSYCPSNPESYRLYFDILDEYLDVLRPKRVHVGHDEWRAGAFCPRCRGKDTGALYAEDVLRIHRHLREKGIETCALEHVGQLLPEVRGMLAQPPPPSFAADPMRFEVLDIVSGFNRPPKGEGWDLSGLVPGRHYVPDLPYDIADPAIGNGRSAVVVARRPGEEPVRATLPVRGRWASLVFIQSSTGSGRPSIHAGDQTHFPRESSELLGFYEIRYDETVGRWDQGRALPLYLARPLVAGTLPDGRTAVVWASEWTNPRPDVPIASVTLVGAPGPSNARPILLGVTAVEKPRVEDLR